MLLLIIKSMLKNLLVGALGEIISIYTKETRKKKGSYTVKISPIVPVIFVKE